MTRSADGLGIALRVVRYRGAALQASDVPRDEQSVQRRNRGPEWQHEIAATLDVLEGVGHLSLVAPGFDAFQATVERALQAVRG